VESVDPGESLPGGEDKIDPKGIEKYVEKGKKVVGAVRKVHLVVAVESNRRDRVGKKKGELILF